MFAGGCVVRHGVVRRELYGGLPWSGTWLGGLVCCSVGGAGAVVGDELDHILDRYDWLCYCCVQASFTPGILMYLDCPELLEEFYVRYPHLWFDWAALDVMEELARVGESVADDVD